MRKLLLLPLLSLFALPAFGQGARIGDSFPITSSSAGNVPVATGPTAATWEPPGSGALTNITNTFTAQQNFDANTAFKGPNPWYDLTRFGLYLGSGGSITCSIAPTSNQASCPSGIGDFAQNQGIEIPLAGVSATFPAWGTTAIASFSRTSNVAEYLISGTGPMLGAGQTVRISGLSDATFNGTFTILGNDGDFNHFFATNSGSNVATTASAGTAVLTSANVVVAPVGILNGTHTCTYKIVQRGYHGELSAASPAGTTAACTIPLGITSVNVTSASRASGLVTVTTASAHNFQAGVQVDFEGSSQFGTGANQYNGVHMIASIPDGTHFTFYQLDLGNDSGTDTGGTAKVVAKNLVRWPMLEYTVLQSIIYRQIDSGTWSIVGVTEGMDGAFVDWGLSAPNVPSYIPIAPPSSSTPGILATTITGITGTRLTLAANATNTATSQTTQHDNTPIVLAGCAALPASGGGELRIPAASPLAPAPFNSPLDLYHNCTNKQLIITAASQLTINDPWIMKNAHTSVRSGPGAAGTGAQFTSYTSTSVFGQGYPFFYYVPGSFGPNTLTNLSMNCNSPYQSCLLTDFDGGGGGTVGFHFDNNVFSGSAGSMPIIMRGGFNFTFNGGVIQVNGGTWGYPEALQMSVPNPLSGTDNGFGNGNGFQMPTIALFNKVTWAGHGIEINDWGISLGGIGAGHMTFTEPIIESPWGPFMNVYLTGSGSAFNEVDVVNSAYADFLSGTATPFFAFAPGNMRVGTFTFNSPGCANSNQPLLEGNFTGGVRIVQGTSAACSIIGSNNVVVDYVSSDPGNQRLQKGSNIQFSNSARAYYIMDSPAAPTLALAAGGSDPLGSSCYAIFAYDPDGGTTLAGAQACITVTTGNQTVTITRPTLPGNAVAWNVNWVSPGGNAFLSCSSMPLTTTSFSHSSGSSCGNPFNLTATAGKANVGPAGISAYQMTTNQADLIDTIVGNPAQLRGRLGYHNSLLTCTNFDGTSCIPTGTTITVASGTAALGTGAITAGTCATVVTVSATGVATTDDIMADFNADPTSTTGYAPSTNGMLTIIKYPTTNNINIKVCNNTSSSITPGAITLNWRVVR